MSEPNYDELLWRIRNALGVTDAGVVRALLAELEHTRGIVEMRTAAWKSAADEAGALHDLLATARGDLAALRTRCDDAEAAVMHFWISDGRCPCGARREAPDTHSHVGSCPVGRFLASVPAVPSTPEETE